MKNKDTGIIIGSAILILAIIFLIGIILEQKNTIQQKDVAIAQFVSVQPQPQQPEFVTEEKPRPIIGFRPSYMLKE